MARVRGLKLIVSLPIGAVTIRQTSCCRASRRTARMTLHVGKGVTSAESVGVIGAEHPRFLGQQLPKLAHRLLHPTRLTKPGAGQRRLPWQAM
jgi:hypothetical protein